MTILRKPKRGRRQPRNGKYFIALYVGVNQREARELTKMLRSQGVLVGHFWRPSDSTAPLHERAVPEDAEIVIIERGPGVNNQDRKRLDNVARDSGLFCVSDALLPRGICMRLMEWGYSGAPLDEPEEEEQRVIEAAEPQPAASLESLSEPSIPATETPSAPESSSAILGPCRTAKDNAALLRRLRDNRVDPHTGKPFTASGLGRAIGLSTGYVSQIEKLKLNPAANVCSALEAFFEIPERTFARLAMRNNHLIGDKLKALLKTRATPASIPGSRDIAAPVEISPPLPALAPPPAPVAPKSPTPEEHLGGLSDTQLIQYLRVIQRRLPPEEQLKALTRKEYEDHLGAIRKTMMSFGLEIVEVTPRKLTMGYLDAET